MFCPYCGLKAIFHKSSEFIYGKDYGAVYACANYPKCDSFVSCHKDSNIEKGSLANSELRELRKKCHKLFDPLWKGGQKKRTQAYGILAHSLGISIENCHIGYFDVDMCNRLIKLFKGDPR
jgi:hypothetical protein